MKMVYYEPVKIIINALELAKIIFYVVIQHNGLPDFIVIDKNLLFTFKFWLLLCYFFNIKQKFSIAYYL